jgi:hypothetical protein
VDLRNVTFLTKVLATNSTTASKELLTIKLARMVWFGILKITSVNGKKR